MEARHNEIKREEYLRVAWIGVLTGMTRNRLIRKAKRRSGHMMLHKFLAILYALDAEERNTEEHRGDEANDQERAPRGLCSPDCENHSQAAANQHGSVRRAVGHVDCFTGGGEVSEIPSAINQIGAKQSAKEHDFSGEEDPHTQAGSIALLLRIGKVVQQLWVVLFFVMKSYYR